MLSLEEIYPPFALRISGGPIEMRVLRDDDFGELVELIRNGVEKPDLPMPFNTDWHQRPYAPGLPDGLPATSLAWWWQQRAMFHPDNWRLALAVRSNGELVGVQDVIAKDFLLTKHIETGSWLGLAHQGKGIGTLMRALVVGFAFDELGAQSCGSGYVIGNHASAAVSRKVGYRENGRGRIVQTTAAGKVGVDHQQVVVTPATYIRPDQDVSIEGAAVLRRFFAIDSGAT